MSELKPCKCGAKVRFYMSFGSYQVKCPWCGIYKVLGPARRSAKLKQAAIAAWNKRVKEVSE